MDSNINLVKIDTNNIEDQLFLYEIVKFRFLKPDIVNIKYKHSACLPSFEEHVAYINSGKYKKIYRINFKDLTIGSIYIDKDNINGTFLLPSLLKKAVKTYKDDFKKEREQSAFTKTAHIKLFELHPDVEYHYATANPKNTLSLDGMQNLGYEIIEIVLVRRTKDGKMIDHE
jgi:hypothetical protein